MTPGGRPVTIGMAALGQGSSPLNSYTRGGLFKLFESLTLTIELCHIMSLNHFNKLLLRFRLVLSGVLQESCTAETQGAVQALSSKTTRWWAKVYLKRIKNVPINTFELFQFSVKGCVRKPWSWSSAVLTTSVFSTCSTEKGEGIVYLKMLLKMHTYHSCHDMTHMCIFSFSFGILKGLKSWCYPKLIII